MPKRSFGQMMLALHKYFPDHLSWTGTPMTRALVCTLAHRDGMLIDEWIEFHMRVLVLLALPAEERQKVLHYDQILRYNEGSSSAEEPSDWFADYVGQGVIPSTGDFPSDDAFAGTMMSLREDAEAAVEQFGSELRVLVDRDQSSCSL